MILKDCNLGFSDSIRSRISGLLGDNYTVERFHLEEYNRDYDVFKCKSNTQSIVLKKCRDMDEINSYSILTTANDNSTPKVYFIEPDDEGYWLAMEYLESVNGSWCIDAIVELATRLARIHTALTTEKIPAHTGVSPLKTWRHAHTTKDDLYQCVDSEITMEHMDVVFKSHEILRNTQQTFIHGDMIPLNMIVSAKGVRIIDWEHGQLGPYILDLGRLLADYNIDKPWINPEWESDILKSYHRTLTERGLAISYAQMSLEYQCARLVNYFGIVYAFKTKQWDRTWWYDLNLKQMLGTIGSIMLLF